MTRGAPTHNEPPPTINVTDYGSFSGLKITHTLTGKPLPAAVDGWLGIDYALQPVGDRRFRPIQGSPEAFEGTKNATSYGKVCVQDPKVTKLEQDEACLNFNVFRTAGVPLTKKLPTLVWIHGGGFVLGSGHSMDGAPFVASSQNPIMVITFNYRLNSLGFLPSTLFEEEGLLNLGLRDQRFLLEFLQSHLEAFGGDPRKITLAGRSAGAHSVGIHYFHNYGEDKNKAIFAQAIFQSGAVTGRAFPDSRYPLYRATFETYMQHLNCPTNRSNAAALACLRRAPIDKIQSISSKLYAEAESTLSWPFQPTLGGPLLEKPGSQSGVERTFFPLPAITSHTTDEGKFYTPSTLQTNHDFLTFMHRMNPYLNITDIALLNELYPDPTSHIDSPYANSPNSTQYNRLSAAWSDMAYICPSRETAVRLSSAGVPTWRVRFNAPDRPLEYQAWRGIPHTSDTRYTYNSPDVPYPHTARIFHAYLASFVTTGNPNTARFSGSSEWPQYGAPGKDGSHWPQQLVVHPSDFTAVERDIVRVRQCEFWNDPERASRLNK
ncbi:alpha/beta-hydrolase [Thozetella sp. PMI_491]|nr:alpha/beta-hydrolase [Thozetella sp. PMI_491]